MMLILGQKGKKNDKEKNSDLKNLGFPGGLCPGNPKRNSREDVLDPLSLALGALVGVTLGLIGAYFWQRKLVLDLKERDLELANLREKLSWWEGEKDRLQKIYHELERNFENLSRKFLELVLQTTHQSRRDHEEVLNQIVAPLAENLKRLDQEIRRLEKDRVGAYERLEEQLRALVREHLPRLEEETRRLSQALSDPGVRGRWGETQLRRVLEWTGMLPHCHFTEQISLGEGRRPDVVVRLPGQRTLALDAKAPLKPFFEAMESGDLRPYFRALRQQIKDLSSKEYWSALTRSLGQSPEFVVLFLPAEAMLNAILREAPEVLEEAFKQRVILATPSLLVALLRTVSLLLKEEKVLENAQKIVCLAQELYDRLLKLTEHLSNLGQALGKSVEHYDRLVGAFESRVLVSARRLKEFGTGGKDISAPSTLGRLPRKS